MEEIIKKRREVAKLLLDVILGRISVLEALKTFPKDSKDPSINTCFHILVHFEADEDLRAKDNLYKETQDDFLIETAETLAKGEALPYNIIEEYKDFYKNDLIYHKITKDSVIARLLKSINL